MNGFGKTLDLLLSSIVRSDLLILIAAILTLVMLVAVCVYKSATSKEMRKHELEESITLKYVKRVKFFYTLFITLISLFPLLGMLGTVFGLLGLDLAAGDMENIKNNFFIALTSTAWGIIFSVFFKVANAFIEDSVEQLLAYEPRIKSNEQEE